MSGLDTSKKSEPEQQIMPIGVMGSCESFSQGFIFKTFKSAEWSLCFSISRSWSSTAVAVLPSAALSSRQSQITVAGNISFLILSTICSCWVYAAGLERRDHNL